MNEVIDESSRAMMDELKNSIIKALKEEKEPALKRYARILSFSTLLFFGVSLPVYFMFHEQMESIWIYVAVFWWVLLIGGFAFYYKPQPRLEVPGLLTPWIFGKIAIVAIIINMVQILICPDFVFLSSPTSWSPFRPITHWFMSVGGMTMCMASCGFIFSLLSSLVALSTVARTMKRFSGELFFKVSSFSALIQLPIFVIQFADSNLRAFSYYWLAGSLTGIALATVLVSSLSPKMKR